MKTLKTYAGSISALLLIAFASTTSLAADVDSLHVTRLTAVRDAYPYWSPDGQQIVFQSDRPSEMQGKRQIYIMNADGSDIRQVTHSETSDETPVWSPDGTTILFSAYIAEEDNELYLINVDGTGLRRLTNNPSYDGHAKFSYDGQRIIFNSMRDGSETYDLYEMNVDGTDVQRLTDFAEWDTYPSISPDGTRILWRRVLPTGGDGESGRNSEIFLMNRDGSGIMNLSNHPSFDGYPAWSPDGKKIAFASNRDRQDGFQGNFHLYIMDADGSNVVKLLENEKTVEDARPIWSPDGTRIVFNRQYVADESSIDILILELPEHLQAPPQ